MGCRGTFGYERDGVRKEGYTHWDSYPDGLGVRMVEFCAATSIEEHNKIFDNIVVVSDFDPVRMDVLDWAAEHNMVNMAIGEGTLRNYQNVLGRQEAAQMSLRLGIDGPYYLYDGSNILYTDFSYIVNLDTNMLDFYGYPPRDSDDEPRGFQLLRSFDLRSLGAEMVAEMNEACGYKDVNVAGYENFARLLGADIPMR